jgi:hypothetical protein
MSSEANRFDWKPLARPRALAMAAAAASSVCGGAGCGPHCSSSRSAVDDALEERMGRLSISGAASTTCGKCDGGGAAVAVPGGIGMCGECFRAHLFGKFKLAVTSNAMVRPTDAVLLLQRLCLQVRYSPMFFPCFYLSSINFQKRCFI